MNGPAPTVAVDNNTSITSRVGVGPVKKKQKTKMCVTTATKITTTWPNVEKLQRSNSTKRPNMGPRLFREKGLILSFRRD